MNFSTKVALLISCFVANIAAVAVSKPVAPPLALEELGAELLQPATSESGMPLDQTQGEDLGIKKTIRKGWLSKVVEHMQTAQLRLRQPESIREASLAQSEALVGIDAMIAELSQRKSQCSGGKCEKPAALQPGKKPGHSGKPGANPAPSANSQTGSDLPTNLAATGQLVKDLWGKLPARQREQILQPLREEFLPKYANEIEAYYRDLASPKQSPNPR